MSPILEIVAEDPCADTWLLRRYDRRARRLVVPDAYKPLQCRRCGKVDEFAALAMGLLPGITIRSNKDYVGTLDGMVCVSARLAAVLRGAGLRGLEFVDIPGCGSHVAARPTLRAAVDRASSGMRFDGPGSFRKMSAELGVPLEHPLDFNGACPTCGRYYEVLHAPLRVAVRGAPESNAVFVSDAPNETVRGILLFLWCTPDVMRLMLSQQISGIDEFRPLP